MEEEEEEIPVVGDLRSTRGLENKTLGLPFSSSPAPSFLTICLLTAGFHP